MDVKGRVAVVTGAGSGLGRAAALELAECGARVAVLDRDRSRVEAVAEEAGCELLTIAVDVADEQSVDQAFAAIGDTFGEVHVCVNAAGVGDGGKIVSQGHALPLASFRKVIDVNLVGTFDVMRRCAALMTTNEPDDAGERGVIINVSSGAAWQGQRGQAAYSASKAGLIGLMLPTARDVADAGVRVVTIAPGLFDTGMTAGLPDKAKTALNGMVLHPKRMGDPTEFAALVRHIVENPYLNATTLSIDGGVRMT